MVWPNEDVFNLDPVGPSFVVEGGTEVFLVSVVSQIAPPTPVPPEVEIDPLPEEGPIQRTQEFTVTVLFNEAPTEMVLECLNSATEAGLDESKGATIYVKGEGFRGGFQQSTLEVTMSGKLYTFQVKPDNPWVAGALRFVVAASDSTGGSTA